ncbi:MAG: RnfABCDGE type electron transport complex subunit A [Clostridia bacterium]|nr:RnfABCDGE type electron transport complex subunit A [Clostridia bacterium]
MSNLLTIFLAGILTENMILSKFLGICPFLGVSKKVNTAFSMSLAVIVVMLISTLVTYPIYAYILVPAGREYLQTIVFILIIAALVQFIEMALKRYMPPLYNALGIYLPLITTNCAVLGITLLHFTKELNYLEAIFNALGAGVGFMVAMVLFAGVRQRIESADIPKVLQGLPITLISAAIVALSFLGFAGIVG